MLYIVYHILGQDAMISSLSADEIISSQHTQCVLLSEQDPHVLVKPRLHLQIHCGSQGAASELLWELFWARLPLGLIGPRVLGL